MLKLVGIVIISSMTNPLSLFLGATLVLNAGNFAFAQAPSLPPNVYPGLRGPAGELIPAVAQYLGKDLSFYDQPVQSEMIARHKNFGYSDEEIKKYFSIALHMPLDNTGLDPAVIKPVPAAGIHPRVLFNPDDVPLIKHRLETTESGKAIHQGIWDQCKTHLTDENAPLRPYYNALIAGDQQFVDRLTLPYSEFKRKYPTSTFPAPAKGDGPVGIPERLDLGVSVMYESFRCLIDSDQEGGKKVAAAVTTLAIISRIEMEAAQRKKDSAELQKEQEVLANGDLPGYWGTNRGETYQGSFGLAYDFAFPFMTPKQRDTVRSYLADESRGLTVMGAETLRTLHTGTSNWISWNNRLIFIVTAIEGEPGADSGTRERVFNSQTNFVNAIYSSGEGYEGWAKNFIMMEHNVIMAKRGRNICGSTNIRATFNNYYIASLNPWGNAFTFCDSQGSSQCHIARGSDVCVYHSLFPNDEAGDFVYRNQVGNKYDVHGWATHPFYVLDALAEAIFCRDFSAEPWDKEYAEVSAGRPLTYWSDDTGNMITRNSWSKDTLYLDYLTRCVPGGHQYSDRGHFSLYGLGRYWSIYHYGRQIGAQYRPTMRSVPLADGDGTSVMMGKAVSFSDQPMATFTVSDLSASWEYRSCPMHPPTGFTKIPCPFSYNDFRLHPSPLAWMSLPTAQLPGWIDSKKPDNPSGWIKFRDVKRAFRTAGLVRGPHPYALITDDLQLDDKPHDYEWGMVLADDLKLGSVKPTPGTGGMSSADIIIDESVKPTKDEPNPANDRHLLVRVLTASGLKDSVATVDTIPFANPPQRDMQVNKLRVYANTVAPDFKVLLFPYRNGDSLPLTTWNSAHTAVTVSWPDQTDVLSFIPTSQGRAVVEITREGQELISSK